MSAVTAAAMDLEITGIDNANTHTNTHTNTDTDTDTNAHTNTNNRHTTDSDFRECVFICIYLQVTMTLGSRM